MSEDVIPPLRQCPICGRPPSAADQPFCSRRCADVDLNRWLGGVYAIPLADDEGDEEAGWSEPPP